MATRTLEIDLRQGTGASSEPMYGVVTVQRAKAKSAGGFEILPFETSLKLINGKATITEAETDGTGPFYDSVYLFRVQNGYCGRRYGFMAALPDGTTPITTGELPMVDPITGEGIYMDAQEWNDLYGDLPNRVSATENRLTLLDGQGQRGYIVKQQAGRTVSVWDYLNNREQIIYGDTGIRDITALAPNVTSGKLYLYRDGNTVTLIFDAVQMAGATGSSYDMIPSGGIPTGFRPTRTFWFHGLDGPPSNRRIGVSSAGWVPVYLAPVPGDTYRGTISWRTAQPWPTVLPGVAV